MQSNLIDSCISATGEGQLKGEVIFIETIGEEGFFRIRLKDAKEINVKIDNNLKLKTGEFVNLAIDYTRMYLFDNSGIRIRTANSS